MRRLSDFLYGVAAGLGVAGGSIFLSETDDHSMIFLAFLIIAFAMHALCGACCLSLSLRYKRKDPPTTPS